MHEEPQEISIGRYLATRLVQLGARHVFGLPGDFNLSLLDEMLSVPDLVWNGSGNELNAAYAADGYARVGRRPGALVTTYGVGELSALNGIAGSYAEGVPVAHIVGMPAFTAISSGEPLHHTFLDGDLGRFARMAGEVTAAVEVLRPSEEAAQIDRALAEMLVRSRPVYIGVPLDRARAMTPASRLDTALPGGGSDPGALADFRDALRTRIAGRPSVTVLAGPHLHRRSLEGALAELAGLPGVRVASQPGSKAILDEGHPASLGTYMGAVTRSAHTRAAVDDADPLILIGTILSDFTTGFFTQRYDSGRAVELALDHARIGHAVYGDVHLHDALQVLHEVVRDARLPSSREPGPRVRGPEPARGRDPGAPLAHEHLWPEIQSWLSSDSTILAEAGTAFYGAIDLDLPDRSDLLGQPVWSSIGFTLPAALGAALARPDRRPVLFIGDGSAQLTIQEIGQLFRSGANPVVFLIDNDGYTVERKIQSPEAVYQDIIAWDWPLVPRALGAPHAVVATAGTLGELRAALAQVERAEEGALVRLVLPRDDAPRLLLALAEGISAANSD